jgi:CBS domain-containing protein
MRLKDFKLCGDLQDQIEALEVNRQQLPSVDEIKAEIRSIEADIASAARSRNFEAAAEGQTKLEHMKKRLQECLDADEIDESHTMGETSVVDNEAAASSSFPSTNGPDFAASSGLKLEHNITNTAIHMSESVTAKDVKRTEALHVKSSPEGMHFQESIPTAVVEATASTPVASKTTVAQSSVKPSGSGRTVGKLRPAKAVCSHSTASITSVASMLSAKRASSCIILGEYGEMVGIVTDTDFTRRAVAKASIDLDATPISTIMTPQPACVSISDAAIDALTKMLENHSDICLSSIQKAASSDFLISASAYAMLLLN